MANTVDYWNHNVAYHDWLLQHIQAQDTVLDVGCGEGLLVSRLEARCKRVIGLDAHLPSIVKAQGRIKAADNAEVHHASFEDFEMEAASVDAVIFVASIHHMDMDRALEKAKILLAPGGRLLIVGIARPAGLGDYFLEACRIIPARIGSLLHHETSSEEIQVPTAAPTLSFRQIRAIAEAHFPRARLRRGLYYRYLLSWVRD